MAAVLVLVEHAEGTVKKVTLELLTAARALGEPVAVVVGAPGSAAAAGRQARRVRRGDGRTSRSPTTSTSYLVTPQVEVLADLVAAESPAAVLLASSAEGKEVAARLAIRTGSGILTDAVDLDGDGASRPRASSAARSW